MNGDMMRQHHARSAARCNEFINGQIVFNDAALPIILGNVVDRSAPGVMTFRTMSDTLIITVQLLPYKANNGKPDGTATSERASDREKERQSIKAPVENLKRT